MLVNGRSIRGGRDRKSIDICVNGCFGTGSGFANP